MKLYLIGHDYKYASEQILLTLFPTERPEYPEGKPTGDRLEIRLSRGGIFTTASCRLHIGDKSTLGRAAVKNEALTGELIRDRYCQRLIKNAVYRAAREYGVERPAWGALTGVRPGKILCGILNSGIPEEELFDWCCLYPDEKGKSPVDFKANFDYCTGRGILPCVCIPEDADKYRAALDYGCRMFTSNDILACDRLLRDLGVR